jgi:hypothetical protein
VSERASVAFAQKGVFVTTRAGSGWGIGFFPEE